jgi:Holliday junction resolvasome RuvABC endonuclease subunit
MKLYIDIGTKMGYALTCAGEYKRSGTMNFYNQPGDGKGMRYLRFQRWLKTMPLVKEVKYEVVLSHKGVYAAHVYGAFEGILQAWCEESGRTYEGIAVGTIKKAATGRGNASKEMMIAAARKAGYSPVDDNEADALCIMIHFGGG